jgi:3-dehydroquinate dehydratase type I
MKTLTVRNLKIGEGIPKIISPIMQKTEEEILKDAGEMKHHPVDAAEFRADAWENAGDTDQLVPLLKKIREQTGSSLPILFTLRSAEEGGARTFTDEEYTAICRAALHSGCIDLIDLERNRHPQPLLSEAKAAGIPVILSFHDFRETPSKEEMVSLLKEMEQEGADIAKIAVTPQEETDVLHLLTASYEASLAMSIPVITISMGEMGQISRISGEVFGSSMTFASTGNISAPGQLNAETMSVILKGMHEERISTGHIFLIGFMGAGKSTAAKALGEKTHRPVYEMDEIIEKTAGMSVSDVFSLQGEEGFRSLETESLKALKGKPAGIVSCGGGIVTRPENIPLMKSMGTVVLLQVKPETVAERLKSEKENRPLLKGEDSGRRIRELMESRKKAYEEAADITVSTDGRPIDRICAEILIMVENRREVY